MTRNKSKSLLLWAAGLISMSVVLIMFLAGFVSYINSAILDKLYSPHDPAPQVKVIAIDEASLAKYGRWPWDRSVWADLITQLAKSKVRSVAFDVIFSEPSSSDNKLQAAIAASPKLNITLAGKILEYPDRNPELLKPLDAFTGYPNVHTAYANLNSDKDLVVHTTNLLTKIDNTCYGSLAFTNLQTYFAGSTPSCDAERVKLGFTSIDHPQEMLINYLGGKGAISTISLADYLQQPDKYQLANSIVFVGTNIQDLKLGLDDNLSTPFGLVPGVEIHSQIVSSVIDNQLLTRIPVTTQVVILIILSVILIAVLANVRFWLGTLFAVVLTFGYVLAVVFAFNGGYVLNVLYGFLCLFTVWVSIALARYYLHFTENIGLKRAFSQYVNEKLLNQITKNPELLKLGGEKRKLTILFSDIRGFTTLSESLTPESLVQFLNSYLTKASDRIFANDGIVDKYIGDAIMALWNAPLDDSQQAYHACTAAIEMMGVLEEFNQNKNLPKQLQIGIGINTGDVVVGNMGSEKRFDYTAIGDDVNLASRLEGLTKQYKVSVIVGENVVDQLEKEGSANKFALRRLDKVRVKGKTDAVTIYELQGLVDAKYAELNDKFQSAWELYHKGDFKTAQQLFAEVKSNYNDGASSIFSERCKVLLSKENLDWQGVWNWETK